MIPPVPETPSFEDELTMASTAALARLAMELWTALTDQQHQELSMTWAQFKYRLVRLDGYLSAHSRLHPNPPPRPPHPRPGRLQA